MKINKNILIVFLVALAVRLTVLLSTDNAFYGGDAYSRLAYAFKLYVLGDVYLSPPDYNSGQFILYRPLFWLFNDLVFPPRVLNVILDSLTTVFLYKISRLYFRKETSLFLSLAYATSYIFVLFSTVTLADSPVNFFVISGFYYFIRADREDSYKLLIFSATLLAYGNFIKTQAWIPSFVLGLILIYKTSSIKKILTYGFISSLPIFAFFLVNYIEMGEPLWFLTLADDQVVTAGATPREFWETQLARVKYGFVPFIGAAFLPGLFVLFKFAREKYLALPFLAFVVVFGYKLYYMEIYLDPRYFLPVSTFSFLAFGAILDFLVPKRLYSRALSISVLSLFFASVFGWAEFDRKVGEETGYFLPSGISQMTSELAPRIKFPGLRYMINGANHGYEDLVMLMLKQNPLQRVAQPPPRSAIDPIRHLGEELHQKHIHVIINLPDGNHKESTRSFLGTPKGKMAVKEFGYRSIYSDDEIDVYLKMVTPDKDNFDYSLVRDFINTLEIKKEVAPN